MDAGGTLRAMRSPLSRLTSSALLVLALAAAGCHSTPEGPAAPADHPDVVAVQSLLVGTFDSSAQAAAAPDDYFPIRLVMVPIWPERPDARWLYVEQAVGAALERPYRQRVYRLALTENGEVESRVFTLPDPKAAIAAWQRPEFFASMTPEQLELRAGCSTFLARGEDGIWRGATRGTDCASSLGGASHATSKVTLELARVLAWDQGWSADGEQVWGPVPGPYEFVRTSVGAPD